MMNTTSEFSSNSLYGLKKEAFQVQIAPDELNLPFPLTPVQYAYFIGRQKIYDLGGVATHYYFEYDYQDLDIFALEKVWNWLIQEHPMMRAVIASSGLEQRILQFVPLLQIPVDDISKLTKEEQNTYLSKKRKKLSHQVLNIHEWPPFDVRVTKIQENLFRLHLDFDNIFFDAWSVMHIINMQSKLYKQNLPNHTNKNFSFRDYVITVQKLSESTSANDSKNYWRSHIKELPPAPQLPIKQQPKNIKNVYFTRRLVRLKKKIWDNLCAKAHENGISPSVLILSVYAQILKRWSNTSHFTINTTLFNRLPINPDVDTIIGDFTSLILLEIDLSKNETFVDSARNIQKQLWKDIEHSTVNTLDILRDIEKDRKYSASSSMPIVFTSAIGIGDFSNVDTKLNGTLVYHITQTPQVWLDHQVYEDNGDLVLTWDAVEDLFPEELLDSLVQAQEKLLLELSSGKLWNSKKCIPLPPTQSTKRIKVNSTNKDIKSTLLYSEFIKNVNKYPSNIAIATLNNQITYEKLHAKAAGIAEMLLSQKIPPCSIIGVFQDKSIEQISTVLGILFAGCTYLPIDTKSPIDRICNIIDISGVSAIITDKVHFTTAQKIKSCNIFLNTDGYDYPNWNKYIENKPNETAYIIFTSGSTGVPKGVSISHDSAINTIYDINDKIELSSNDSILSISNLNFDLSVWDIFGILSVGGKVILPDPEMEREPSHWIELIQKYKINIWNSVPALFQILLYHLEYHDKISIFLRYALLSGDFIPIDVPSQALRLIPNINILSLGGATEASIWSIFYRIGKVNSSWKSIPYGMPLSNQRFYIYNENFESCPDWVPGEIFIAGRGLAKGYVGDPEKTNERFIIHPITGERLYKTGDLGCFHPDGNIEILGRNDTQIKIHGYRVELGEIEHTIDSHPSIKKSVVIAQNKLSDNSIQIFAYFESKNSISENEIKAWLKSKLPEYMIPTHFANVTPLPLTENGKIDRKNLPAIKDNTKDIKVLPSTETEKIILSIWESILKISISNININFFAIGGDSLSAARLMSSLNKTFELDLPLKTIFEYPSIKEMAILIEQNMIISNMEVGEL